jgi:hypothetical protein
MNMASMIASMDFLQFVDDHIRKMWVCFLKLRSKVFYEFKKFKALVEKSSLVILPLLGLKLAVNFVQTN